MPYFPVNIKVRPGTPYLVNFVKKQFDDFKRSSAYWFFSIRMFRFGVGIELFSFGNKQSVHERLNGFEELFNSYFASNRTGKKILSNGSI